MNLEEWYNKGMTAQDYVDQMESHQTDLIYIYENFSVAIEDQPLFEQLQKKKLRAIVLTEDWCGDAMLNLPIFLRIAEASHIPTHFLLRDENDELMNQYLTNGSRSIPKLIFIDSEGKEVGTWGPRAPQVQEFIKESFAQLPDKNAEDFQEKRKEMLTFVTKAYRDNQDIWQSVYHDFKRTLK